MMIDTEKNCFWRNSVFKKGTRGGAGSIIDFAMEFMNYERNEAMRAIAVMYNIHGDKKPEVKYIAAPERIEQPKREIEALDLPPKAANSNAVFRYLLKDRKIDRSVILYFLAKKMLYQDAKHNNCIFVSNKFACARSTSGQKFVGDVKGCDYNECFFFRPSNSAKTLVVAESVIDVMSIMTLFVWEGKRYTNYVYLALAGTNKLQSLFYHLEKEKNINHILIAFDNDEAGTTAGEAAITGLNNMGYKGIIEIFAPPSGKDWNDYIKMTGESKQN